MTTALYRRYRPDTFQDVIGQEHVTTALQNALSSDRIAHAFLFSGPRGCGKTTSARILARSLNCAEGPTPTPCGKCESCIELASGGPGSLDVMEIDAASNSGVDDARSLRERAEFAPTRDRYRVFILDEAHMVTSHGFNALLKLVEEPPEHVKFIFATTEPDKVISTIRSRTHHYPFRLVPPNVLMPYLRKICTQEKVTIDEAALPLVVRAGGGSVRDSLSVLDQLIAGSDGNVTLQQASHLLGFTDSALLDRMVDALGTGDGAAAFSVVEEVVGGGHEPRRFVEDLLQRLRDMIVAALAGPERSQDILLGVPSDQLATMLSQASQWGTRLMSRRADMVEAALREMTGATAPRLQLELLVARLLVEQPSGESGPATTVSAATYVPPAKPSPEISAPSVDGHTTSQSSVPVSTEESEGEGATAPTQTAKPAVQDAGTGKPVPQRSITKPQVRKPQSKPTVSPVASTSSPEGTAPTEDQVRSQWRPLLAAMGSRSALYGSLLGATRRVESVGRNVRFTFAEEGYVRRFKNMKGEKDLGEVLSELFGMPLSAEVGTAEQLVAGPVAGASSLESVSGKADLASVERANTDGPTSVEPISVVSDLPDYLDEDEPVADDVRTEPATDMRQVDAIAPEDDQEGSLSPRIDEANRETSADPTPKNASSPRVIVADTRPSETDDLDEAKYRGMPAADRVLNILGGQIIDEVIEQAEDE